MGVNRKHARHKVPVQLFYDNQHLKLIDFSLGRAGAELGNIQPPDSGSTLKLV